MAEGFASKGTDVSAIWHKKVDRALVAQFFQQNKIWNFLGPSTL